MIEVRGVSKRYGEKVAVDDLTFSVAPGIVTGFLGPNGAGKSTTMRLILGLDAPTSGTVLFMTVTGVLCVALATIIRSTAGAIATFAGLLFVLPGIVDILPSNIGDSISPYLPSSAGGAIAQAVPDANTLSPWGGFALYCVYTIVLLAIAAYLLVRRDA